MLLFPFPFARVFFFFFLVNSNRVPPATIDSRLKRRGGEAKLEIKLFSPPPLSLSRSHSFSSFSISRRSPLAFPLTSSSPRIERKGGIEGETEISSSFFSRRKRDKFLIKFVMRSGRRGGGGGGSHCQKGPPPPFFFFSRGVLGSFPFSPLLGDPGTFSSSSSSLEAPSTPPLSRAIFFSLLSRASSTSEGFPEFFAKFLLFIL